MQLDGLLFFPVTPFDTAGDLAPEVLADHVADGVDAGAGGVFAACGTGEFHALDLAEYRQLVGAAVRAAAGRVPVLSGAGGPLPHARACARAAAEAGADGLLLMPPYLVQGPGGGLESYVRQVAEASSLPVIIYQRSNARFSAEDVARLAKEPFVVGFKDGLGDIEHAQRVVLEVREAVGDEFLLFNGLPTAELSAPAYQAVGFDLYSSAAFAFVPEVAGAFHTALRNDDQVVVQRLLSGFYRPFAELRDRVPGYAVSLVKAGARLRGRAVGPVRAPLVDPGPEHLAVLQRIIDDGLRLARG
ncbi:5-dehydro-4-deoxyglucarate dehydratase [Streptomonospora wellingtoniae]|uniref:Probable 5-dehydro-4-deoxyglucarate dehydratase n=1 Tax=Streptomonospora wellingtoniae TaxID=3075544 RepID=A0ABU2KP27_9ACTN|nr:5-dehydro-4-deoxyglucarate dehydratase [Streptomonospora sp. DSM 45055]MDT0300893.1 5-dehydro-4-deoxyglucarate dehydratase [Streptomonospora sp. DSM 45055]